MCEPVDVAKAHEILARFRPIAPKPQLQLPPAPPHAAPPVSRARKRSARSPFAPSAKRGQRPTADPLFPVHPPQPLLVERDLLQKLQEPRVIAPRPVRPVGSSISVGSMTEGSSVSAPPPAAPKRAEEVEEEVESETMPAVVSDYNNRVRLANTAYKELVGQPECMWLDSCMVSGFGRLRTPSRRINGEVMLDFSGSSARPPAASSKGFSCRVKIEWACDGRKTFIDAPCDVIRLHCESKDYLFTWRFRIAEAQRTDCMS